ncbi:hypothetical protein E2C01_088841 [Portunus trituberculatus]|uniref:Uncharacterized protein n=1 Tax=Portunus trituberculatus TaxID=210409 RepID=A0A5B7J784_PORTR|nr:hypothetical protein [Portunus trituberculatus]
MHTHTHTCTHAHGRFHIYRTSSSVLSPTIIQKAGGRRGSTAPSSLSALEEASVRGGGVGGLPGGGAFRDIDTRSPLDALLVKTARTPDPGAPNGWRELGGGSRREVCAVEKLRLRGVCLDEAREARRSL